MAEVRTYVTTGGRKGTPSFLRVDVERVRVDWRGVDGGKIASVILPNAEAVKLAAALASFMAPTPPSDSSLVAPVLSGRVADGRIVLAWTGAAHHFEVWLNDRWAAELPSGDRSWVSPAALLQTVSARVVAHDAENKYVNSNTITLAPVGAPEQPSPTYRYNNLVFEDNFDGPAINPAWSLYYGNGHAGNGIRDPNCWKIEQAVPGAIGGCLVGTAWWDADHAKTTLPNGTVKTGPQMRTPGCSHGLDLLHKRILVRSRVDRDPTGVTAANLPLTWPKDGRTQEFNPWECHAPTRRPVKTFHHYELAEQLPQLSFEHDLDASEWHDVMIETTPDYMRVWCDGKQIVDITDKTKLMRAEHHITLQLDAMRNAPVQGPVRAEIDRVAIWV